MVWYQSQIDENTKIHRMKRSPRCGGAPSSGSMPSAPAPADIVKEAATNAVQEMAFKKPELFSKTHSTFSDLINQKSHIGHR